MAARTVRTRVADILAAIEEIERAFRDHSEISDSWLFHRAIQRGLEIIFEASRTIPEGVKVLAPHIDWLGMASFGNVSRHGYDKVEWSLIVASVDKDLPDLKRFLTSELPEVELDRPLVRRL
jgi:uncharacterized protein with HEPN domain